MNSLTNDKPCEVFKYLYTDNDIPVYFHMGINLVPLKY